MTVKLPKILALILLTIHAVFAQAEPCKDETQKAEMLNDMCAKFDAQSQSYMDCIKLYIEQKTKASDVCKAALLQPVSLAQALRGSSLSGGCVDDFANVLGKEGFSMANFVKELPPAVAKVKVQMKSPFGKPKDGDKTSVGLTVGCIKALPESPAEIQNLLKDVSLKAGLDFAMDAAANSVPANVAKEGGSGGKTLKTAASVVLIGGGLSTLLYGYTQDNKVSSAVKKRDGKAAVEARDNRNIGYGVGAGLLAVGLGVVIIF
jgi:hypothetical protein